MTSLGLSQRGPLVLAIQCQTKLAIAVRSLQRQRLSAVHVQLRQTNIHHRPIDTS